MKRLRTLLRPHTALCCVTAGAVCLSVAVNVLLREYLGTLLDSILQQQVRWSGAAAVLAVGFLLSALLLFGKSWSTSRLLHSLKARLYQDAYSFLLGQDSGGLSLGELSSLLSNDVTAVTNSVNRIFTKLLSDIFCFVFSLAVICRIAPVIAVVVVLSAAIPAAIVTALSRRQQEERQQYMKELAQVNEAAARGLFSLESVKANELEEPYDRQYSRSLSQLLDKRRRLSRTEALLTAPSVFCAFAVQIAIIVVSGAFAASGAISAGSFVVITALMSYIVDPVMGLENSLLALRSLKVSLQRLDTFLGAADTAGFAEPRPVSDAAPGVTLEDVSFAYTPGRNVLEHISLQLTPGRCHMLLGANGAGKSTLIKLIGGVLQPDAGRVLLCGRDISLLERGALAGYLSVMPKEPVLFSDSMLENLRLYQPGISRDDVAAVCKRVGIHQEILALPEQYDTVLSENGGTLSGGQKQRLSLARTLLRDRPIMIFDEPTAALDDAHAAQAAALIRELAETRVVIAITHDARMDLGGAEVIQLGGQ